MPFTVRVERSEKGSEKHPQRARSVHATEDHVAAHATRGSRGQGLAGMAETWYLRKSDLRDGILYGLVHGRTLHT